MMSLPFLLFACGLAAGWTSRREAAMDSGLPVFWCCWCCSVPPATDVLNLGL